MHSGVYIGYYHEYNINWHILPGISLHTSAIQEIYPAYIHLVGKQKLYFCESGRKTLFLLSPLPALSLLSHLRIQLYRGSIKSQIFNILRFSYVTSTFSCILPPTWNPDSLKMKVWTLSQITERYSFYVECRHDVPCKPNRLRCGYYKVCGRNREEIEVELPSIQELTLNNPDENSYFLQQFSIFNN